MAKAGPGDKDVKTPCRYIPSQPDLIEFLAAGVRAGDRLILMSNGSFDGLHDKILERLRS